jgi:hypothetical protein
MAAHQQAMRPCRLHLLGTDQENGDTTHRVVRLSLHCRADSSSFFFAGHALYGHACGITPATCAPVAMFSRELLLGM